MALRNPAVSRLYRSVWIAVCVCSAAALNGCGTKAVNPAPQSVASAPTISAAVWMVKPRRWPTVVASQGNLSADEVAVIGTKVAGRVAEVHVDLGDVVAADAPLVTLDQEEFRLLVQQAKAQLAQARSAVGLTPEDAVEDLEPKSSPLVRQEKAVWDEARARFERIERLQAEKAITRAEFDQFEAAERVAEARHASALNGVHEKISLIGVREAELLLATERLRDATVRSPFDGLIQRRPVAPGAYVQVGDSIATVVRTNPLRFRGTIPERYAQDLVVGQQVRLRIESVEEPRTVCISRVSPVLDPLTRSLLFEALVDNSDQRLRSGLFAEAEIVIDPASESLVVPHSAVVEFAGAEKVWKVVDRMAGEQEVLTGQRRPEGIEILDGLTAGDVILRDAQMGRVARIEPLDIDSDDAEREHRYQLTTDEGEGSQDVSRPSNVSE